MKRLEKVTANLTFIALMCAINGVFALLNAFVPLITFFLILLLPLTTTLVVLACKPRFYIVYYIASSLICYFVSFEGPESIVFTLLPSLLTGTIFGFLIKRKAHPTVLALLSTCSYCLLSLATFPLIKVIYNVDMFLVYQELLKIKSSTIAQMTFLPFIFALSLTQMTLTLFIVTNELKKLNIEYNLDINNTLYTSVACLIAFSLSIVMCFVSYALIYLCMAIAIMCGSFSLTYYVGQKTRLTIVILCCSVAATFFLFALLYSLIGSQFICLVLAIPSLFFSIFDILLNITKKHLLVETNSAKINKEVK